MKIFRRSGCALLLCSSLAVAQAPSYPARTVRIVMGVPAGGQADTLARGVAAGLSARWGHPVIIENRAGTSGILATEMVVKSAPDGHTVFTTDGVQFITNQLMRDKLPYDPVKDLAPVVAVARTSAVMLASAKSTIKSVGELIERARAKPGELNYGSFGIGSSLHLGVEALSAMTDIKVTHVPYKGGPEIVNALLSGDIEFALVGTTAAMAHIKQGRLRVLGSSGPQRSRMLPDVPTIAETVKGYDGQSWFGWLAPAATPRTVIDRIAADVGPVITAPDFIEKFTYGIGLEPLYLPAAPFAELLTSDRAKYAVLIRTLNIKLE